MRIEVNPSSLLNLEHICEVLYKLHPFVLDYLVDMERRLGGILGFTDTDNISLDLREILSNIPKVDFSSEPEETKKTTEPEETKKTTEPEENEQLSNYKDAQWYEEANFYELRKYLQLNTDEYIPMQIYVEVEDPVIGRKVKELVKALEKTSAPEQFYFNKREIDEDAYFAEGYGLTMNEEQKKQRDDFFWGADVEGLKKLLKKEKLYPYFG